MQPNLFTIVLRHPETETSVFVDVAPGQVIGIVMAAEPLQTALIVPTERLDELRLPEELASRAKRCVLCTAREGGYDAVFLSDRPEPLPKWADEFVRGIDFTVREERKRRRSKREAAVMRVEQARERARDVQLPIRYRHEHEMFCLESRAHLTEKAA